ncbi:MAG: M20/M25/M40 family metallo-hydrolase [Fimbriimonadaceae bacterium]|nr:M20/M25/M40 family metallo-hydrolase [Fimbriimonadaceae bacterium]
MTIALLLATQASAGSLDHLVDRARLKSTVERLASWHDRNTNNPTLTEAAKWLESEFKKVPGVQVELMRYPVKKGRRVREDKEVVEVVAVLPGSDDRRILVGGHFDTINMVPRDLESSLRSRAPGANDDGSGTALTLELARVMATRKWKHTLVFVAFSGEEQGLLGSTALAKRAKSEGWKLDAVFNNDMVGNSSNNQGRHETKLVRVFSELSDQHQSRELARFVAYAGGSKDFGAMLVFRHDRFGRGGDHTPFNNEGFTAVRVTDVVEEFSRQHTPDDLPENVDFDYLSNVTKLNLRSMSLLADAGEQPTAVRVDRRQGHSTHITWRSTPGTSYTVYWRATTSPVWQAHKDVGAASEFTIATVNKDDNIFGVGATGGIPVEAR